MNEAKHQDISITDLISSLKGLFLVFKKGLLLILLSGITVGILSWYYAKTAKVLYKSELRFVVKNEGGSTGVGGVLGGLGAVFGGSSVGSPLERTIEIAGSDRILGAALLAEVEYYESRGILANFFIKANNLHSLWSNDSELKNIAFNSSDTSIENMVLSKRKAIKAMQDLLIPRDGIGIVAKSFDRKSGVVTLAATHENEEFSIVLIKAIFNKLRDFYVEQMISSAANNVLILQKKVDSIKSELSYVQKSYAKNSDQSFGLLFSEDKVLLKKLSLKEQMLTSMYAEAQKNLETFKFVNDSAIPTLTVIDLPYSPLPKIKKSVLKFSLLGFMIGSLISFLILLLKEWLKK